MNGRSPNAAYLLELHKINVEPYLEDTERISPAVREVIRRGLLELAEHGDHYLSDPYYRIPGTPYCHFDRILRDPDSGRLRGFYFVISDEAAPYGVLRIIYMDEKNT